MPNSDSNSRWEALAQAANSVIGPANVLTDPEKITPYCVERRGRYLGQSPMVWRPGNVEEISALVRLARAHGAVIVPQGGNTGLVGGQIADETGREIILSLSRLNHIRHIDRLENRVCAEAGVILDNLQQEAAASNSFLPMNISSSGSCQLGGLISTNAGGISALCYGSMRQLVLGLEVVLADGRIWNGLGRPQKDNTGYDLKQLFIGAEGTLGIISAADLKLLPLPSARYLALIAVSDPRQALQLFQFVKNNSAGAVSAFEILCASVVDLTCDYLPDLAAELPARGPWLVLMEVSGHGLPAAEFTRHQDLLLSRAMEQYLLVNAYPAQSERQSRCYWRLRHSLPEGQIHAGASIKHDVSVPVAKLADFLEEGIAACLRLDPHCRPCPFGHLGDGNIHFNISQPVDCAGAAFMARQSEFNEEIYALIDKFSGSVAAEHGVGRMKRQLIRSVKSATELAMMEFLKAAFDPGGQFNPGRIIAPLENPAENYPDRKSDK